jgi:tripartite-type tricarboxylate transporter receptor subunit TctC
MNRQLRYSTILLGAALALLALRPALAQDFPTRPVRMIVPYAAGGPTDVRARLVAQKMSELLGQQVIVENRPGGNTFLGTRAVAEAPADGYTLLVHSSSLTLGPLTFKNPGYKVEDFSVLAPMTIAPFVLAVSTALPVKNASELVAYTKANPGKLNNGSLGAAGQSQLLTERLKDAAGGLQIVDVNYKGTAPALQAVMAGEIQMFMDSLQTSVPAARGGKVRLVGVTSERRVADAPDVPTFKEQGLNVVGGTWTALFAHAKTPQPVLARLSREATRATAAPEVKEKLYTLGSEAWNGTVAEFAAYIKEDAALWEKDLRRLKIPLQD